jgi:HK97 gp10 family phage protein
MGKVTIEGLKDVDDALKDLPKAVGKNILRRVLKKIAEPIAADMRARAPDDPRTKSRDLKASIYVGTKLNDRQKSLHRKASGGGGPRLTSAGWKSDPKTLVEMFVGVDPRSPQGAWQEFGTYAHPAQPFARPAWDGNKDKALATIKADLWAEIEKAAARAARKSARLAARG